MFLAAIGCWCALGWGSPGALSPAGFTAGVAGEGGREAAAVRVAVGAAPARIPAPGPDVPASAAIGISGPDLVRAVGALRAGQWFELPESSMARVQVDACASPDLREAYAPLFAPHSTCAPDQVMAYSGGAWDAGRHRLLVWGGGHAAYLGNEVYAFDIPTARWLRLTEPTAPVLERRWDARRETWESLDPPWPTRGAASGPVSVHSYDQLVYLPDQQQLLAAGGSAYGPGYATALAWRLDLASDAPKWTQAERMPGSVLGLYEYNMILAYDPVSRRAVMRGYTRAGTFDPVTGRWAMGGDRLATRRLGVSGEIDPERRILLVTGGGATEVYPISPTGELGAPTGLATTGDRTAEQCPGPGLAYDSVAKRFVAWCGGRDVYSLDLAARRWTRHEAVAGGGAPPDPGSQRGIRGTYGRFQYMPEYNAYIVVSGTRSNVFVYRFAEQEGSAAAAASVSGSAHD